MALKDIWVDKKDGVDVVRAKDINDIASAIIDIENDMKNDDKDSFAQTLYGNEEDKAPSVKAVNEGLGGKVNAQFFSSGRNRLYCARPNNPNSYRDIDNKPWMDCIPVYTNVETNIAPSASVYGQATIVVVDPKHPYQAANKRYVDNKVAPIKEDVEILKDLSAGVLYDIETVESTVNPVTVPSNALPAANIDKIGTGIKNEIVNEATITRVEYPSVIEIVDADTCTFKIPSGEYTDLSILYVVIPTPILEGETYFFEAKIISGTYEISNGGELRIADTEHLISFGETLEFNAGWERENFDFSVSLSGNTLTCTDLVIKVSWGRRKQTYCVPVASIKKGTETVYTVPEQIRALKVRVDEGAGFQDAYGLALSETLYNYLDLENKQYVINCAEGSHPHGGLWTVEHHEIIDVSAYLTDEDGEITVSAGDRISFCDNDGILVPYDVPNAITYYTKKGV